LFEAAVTRALFKVASARACLSRAAAVALDARGQLTVIPDIVLEHGGMRLVIDAKYKLPAGACHPQRTSSSSSPTWRVSTRAEASSCSRPQSRA